jgi:hypothetical protein
LTYQLEISQGLFAGGEDTGLGGGFERTIGHSTGVELPAA